jgi:hypothetical protein
VGQGFAEQVGEQERRDDVDGEVGLDAVLGELAGLGCVPGVVHQDVEAVAGGGELPGEGADPGLRAQIGQQELDAVIAGASLQLRDGGLGAVAVAARDHDAGAATRERGSRTHPDATRGAGDQDRLVAQAHVHALLLRITGAQVRPVGSSRLGSFARASSSPRLRSSSWLKRSTQPPAPRPVCRGMLPAQCRSSPLVGRCG